MGRRREHNGTIKKIDTWRLEVDGDVYPVDVSLVEIVKRERRSSRVRYHFAAEQKHLNIHIGHEPDLTKLRERMLAEIRMKKGLKTHDALLISVNLTKIKDLTQARNREAFTHNGASVHVQECEVASVEVKGRREWLYREDRGFGGFSAKLPRVGKYRDEDGDTVFAVLVADTPGNRAIAQTWGVESLLAGAEQVIKTLSKAKFIKV